MKDHEPVEPDTFVRTALQLLPVPKHRDGFWDDLRVALDAEPRPAPQRRAPLAAAPRDATAEAPVPAAAASAVVELESVGSLALVPPALRRRSNVVLSAVAVAAAVVVVVAGTTLVRQRNGDTTGTGQLASGSLTTVSSTIAADAGATSADAEASVDAVLGWVESLDAGDMDAAWSALAADSKAHFGSAAAFEAEGSALAEGYGAWSGVQPDEVYVTPLGADDDGELLVVTLVGTVEEEGERRHRSVALPVRVLDGAVHLEPFAAAGSVEFVVPAEDETGGVAVVPAGDELVVVVPSDAGAPTLRLDDGDVLVCGEAEGTELVELDTAPGQRCSFSPPAGLEPGERVLTVAFVAADGSGVSAESILFDAA